MNLTLKGYTERLAELDNLYLSIQKVSGFTVEQLLDMFMAGYEMYAPKYGSIPQLMPEDIEAEKKEAPTMQVSYNGFTGELVKLEARGLCYDENRNQFQGYTLEILDVGKKANILFDLVKLEDVKFLGGAVSFQ